MTIAIITGLVIALVLLRVALTTPPEKLAAFLRTAAPIALIGSGAVLLFLGRGAIGIPLIGLGIGAWQRFRNARPIGERAGAASSVRSRHLEMRLDHDTGEMDGILLLGSQAGAKLSELTEAELLRLRDDVSEDADSLRLLEAYLDRRMPRWRDHAQAQAGDGLGGAPGAGAMTEKQAYEVLGLQPGATLAEIREAHRRLMKRVHPDSGGTDFLAARINEAKALLVDRHH